MTDTPTPDDALFDELQAALQQADAVPDDVLEMAKDSFTWRTVDAELAELVFDSAVDEVAGVRGTALAERELTFRAGDVEIEILLGHGNLNGQVLPPEPGSVELTSGGTTHEASVDSFGAFSFENIPGGPVRLTFRIGDTFLTTEWTVF